MTKGVFRDDLIFQADRQEPAFTIRTRRPGKGWVHVAADHSDVVVAKVAATKLSEQWADEVIEIQVVDNQGCLVWTQPSRS